MSGSHCSETPDISITGHMTTGHPSVSVNVTDIASVCVSCFFPHHCLANNVCLNGTTGPDCGVCQNPGQDGQGYQMVANSCVTCSQVPVAAVALVVFLIMLLLCLVLTRQSTAAVTKIKILVNFVQLLYLALFVKVEWPTMISQLASVLSFSTFTSDVAMMECLLSDVKFTSYIRWLTAVAVPSLIICVGSCIDRGLKNHMKSVKSEYVRVTFEMRRSKLRHFIFLIVVSYYMPVAFSAVQSFSCTSTFGQKMTGTTGQYTNTFLYDPSVSCDGFLFQTFNFVLTLFMLFYIVLMPLLLVFFTLRQRKWALLECKSAKFGFIYNSYTNRFCFWEALTMVRKMASIGLTNTVLTDPLLQSIVLLSLSGFYLLLLLASRPYRKCCWRNLSLNVHMTLEVLCTLSLCVVHTGGLLLALHLYPDQLDILLLAVIFLALLLWLVFALAGRLEKDMNREVTFDEGVEVKESVVAVKPPMRMKRNKVGEYVTSHEVDQRAAQVDF